jgi:hypothetical protein
MKKGGLPGQKKGGKAKKKVIINEMSYFLELDQSQGKGQA